jgi:hypothetical protein
LLRGEFRLEIVFNQIILHSLYRINPICSITQIIWIIRRRRDKCCALLFLSLTHESTHVTLRIYEVAFRFINHIIFILFGLLVCVLKIFYGEDSLAWRGKERGE